MFRRQSIDLRTRVFFFTAHAHKETEQTVDRVDIPVIKKFMWRQRKTIERNEKCGVCLLLPYTRMAGRLAEKRVKRRAKWRASERAGGRAGGREGGRAGGLAGEREGGQTAMLQQPRCGAMLSQWDTEAGRCRADRDAQFDHSHVERVLSAFSAILRPSSERHLVNCPPPSHRSLSKDRGHSLAVDAASTATAAVAAATAAAGVAAAAAVSQLPQLFHSYRSCFTATAAVSQLPQLFHSCRSCFTAAAAVSQLFHSCFTAVSQLFHSCRSCFTAALHVCCSNCRDCCCCNHRFRRRRPALAGRRRLPPPTPDSADV